MGGEPVVEEGWLLAELGDGLRADSAADTVAGVCFSCRWILIFWTLKEDPAKLYCPQGRGSGLRDLRPPLPRRWSVSLLMVEASSEGDSNLSSHTKRCNFCSWTTAKVSRR